MPGFPDTFMPFLDEPPGSKVSTATGTVYGRAIVALRKLLYATLDNEPKWRYSRPELTTGHGLRTD